MDQPPPNVSAFPPITKQRALEIATHSVTPPFQESECSIRSPEGCHIYFTWDSDEPCWYVTVPWRDEKDDVLLLRSSRVIIISRVTGEVRYDGSARDEGYPTELAFPATIENGPVDMT